MTDSPIATVLALEFGGTSLRIDLAPSGLQPTAGLRERWFDLAVAVSAHPFAGTVEAIVTEADLAEWIDRLRAFTPPGEIVLGGDRGVELRLEVEAQEGGRPGAWALSATLVPSGDDPYPSLTFLLFDVAPFWQATATALAAALRDR